MVKSFSTFTSSNSLKISAKLIVYTSVFLFFIKYSNKYLIYSNISHKKI
nr:MAG TPA: hypothetical protein [Caudoviricetes sp.]